MVDPEPVKKPAPAELDAKMEGAVGKCVSAVVSYTPEERQQILDRVQSTLNPPTAAQLPAEPVP